MKKILLSIFLILNITAAYAKVNVVVSIPPQKSYVEEIGGDLVDITLMAPIGTNPNYYEPKRSQMVAIGKADVYFTIGGNFEKAWLPKIKNQNKEMEIFDCSIGIQRLDMKFNKKSKKISSIQKPRKDVHVWTTPKNIAIIGKNIYETLVRYDQKNKEQYKKNYEAFLEKTQKTDAKIRTIFKDLEKDTTFMVYHPAWGYFSKEYHLEQIPIEIEGKEPKPRELKKMIEKGRNAQVKAILTQPEFSTKGAELIANELNIKVLKISPINPQWSENLIKLANAIAENK
ncbi:MAG: zinc ABC transporter substrate-binding protein [Arcobacteraceae bacterium]